MKILYIGVKYDYGDPKRGYSFEHYNFYDSLTKMGCGKHKIVYFPFDETMRAMGRESMNRKLLETVHSERPDLCFFFLFTDEIKKEIIKEISEKSSSVTFNWFADDHWRFDNFSRQYAPLFHWVSTTDSQAPAKYRAMGYRNVIKTQWACNHFLYKPAERRQVPDALYKYDVTFVGQPHGERSAIVKRIEKAGMDIQCWGNGWPNGRVGQEEMIRIFSESKINLNLTKSFSMWGIKPFAKIFLHRNADNRYGFNNPSSWLDNWRSLLNTRREQIKGRNFEIPGSGGFLLTADADNLRDYYEDGEDIAIFKDDNELIEKIRHYLSHDSEREAIARRGYERTIREHTYEKRFDEIFKIMRLS